MNEIHHILRIHGIISVNDIHDLPLAIFSDRTMTLRRSVVVMRLEYINLLTGIFAALVDHRVAADEPTPHQPDSGRRKKPRDCDDTGFPNRTNPSLVQNAARSGRHAIYEDEGLMEADGAILKDEDYAALAEFRFALRQFQAFSSDRAAQMGLTPQQHQALLALRAAPAEDATVGYVARRLLLKPHSATGLVDRLEKLGLVTRHASATDRRRSQLRLTPDALDLLAKLSATHRDEIRRLRPLLNQLLARFA